MLRVIILCIMYYVSCNEIILAGQIPKTQLFAYTTNSNLTMATTVVPFFCKIENGIEYGDLSPT